jgi:hypothetical protein
MGGAFLAAIVVGSGIAAQQLSPGNIGLELLENAAATAAGLYAIILIFGPVSGAHLNPVVSFVDAAFGGLRWRTAAAYLPAQVAGCITGAIAANVMFGRSAVSISTHHRLTGGHLLLYELRKLCESGDHDRPDVLQHLCRHRTRLGPGLRRRPGDRCDHRDRRDQGSLSCADASRRRRRDRRPQPARANSARVSDEAPLSS